MDTFMVTANYLVKEYWMLALWVHGMNNYKYKIISMLLFFVKIATGSASGLRSEQLYSGPRNPDNSLRYAL